MQTVKPNERYEEVLKIVQAHSQGISVREIREKTTMCWDSQVHIIVRNLEKAGHVHRTLECLVKIGKSTGRKIKNYDLDSARRAAAGRVGAQNRREKNARLEQRIETVVARAQQGNTDPIFGGGWYLRQHSK